MVKHITATVASVSGCNTGEEKNAALQELSCSQERTVVNTGIGIETFQTDNDRWR